MIGRKKIKITIVSKNCRLKITIISKNYRLKIPMRACMCTRVRVYVCVYDRGKQDTRPRPGPGPGHHRTQDTTGTHHRKREDSGKAEKPAYIGIFAGNEKKYKKIKEKFGNVKKPPYLCLQKQQNKVKQQKYQSNENNKQRNFREYPRTRIYD